jgi:hypothetical protein
MSELGSLDLLIRLLKLNKESFLCGVALPHHIKMILYFNAAPAFLDEGRE